MNLDIQIFESYGITKIAVKPVGLLHHQNATGPVAFEPCDHSGELFSTLRLRRFHVLKSLDNLEAASVGIPLEELSLGPKGESLLLLFTARDAGIKYSFDHVASTRYTDRSSFDKNAELRKLGGLACAAAGYAELSQRCNS